MGKKGREGYSSVGKIVEKSSGRGKLITVDCVRADDEIGDDCQIDFIKLDLQGGELNALKGMPKILGNAQLLWIEFMGNKQLLEYINQKDFHIFDTEYFFWGSPSEKALNDFQVSREKVILSTGKEAWFGFKKTGWVDYYNEFLEFKKNYSLVQTDICCVRTSFLDTFYKAIL